MIEVGKNIARRQKISGYNAKVPEFRRAGKELSLKWTSARFSSRNDNYCREEICLYITEL
jgi:hypothetical protein